MFVVPIQHVWRSLCIVVAVGLACSDQPTKPHERVGTGTLYGKITDQNGNPIEGATLSLKDSLSESSFKYMHFLSIQSTSDPMPETPIEYQLPEHGCVSIQILDFVGDVVQTFVESEEEPGSHVVMWDGTDSTGAAVPSGFYTYEITVLDTLCSHTLSVETTTGLLLKAEDYALYNQRICPLYSTIVLGSEYQIENIPLDRMSIRFDPPGSDSVDTLAVENPYLMFVMIENFQTESRSVFLYAGDATEANFVLTSDR